MNNSGMPPQKTEEAPLDSVMFTKADEHKYSLERTKVDRGWFGKIFGAPDVAPLYIAAFLLFPVVLGLLIVLCCPAYTGGYEAAKYLAPIVTLGLGYLFGRK